VKRLKLRSENEIIEISRKPKQDACHIQLFTMFKTEPRLYGEPNSGPRCLPTLLLSTSLLPKALYETSPRTSNRVPPNIRPRSHRFPKNSSRIHLQNLFQLPRLILAQSRRDKNIPDRAPFSPRKRWLARNLHALRIRWF
jgi:hypothetical protein